MICKKYKRNRSIYIKMPPVFAVYRCVQMDACTFVVLGLLFYFIFLFKFPCHDFLLLFKFMEQKLEFFISCCCWLHVEKLSIFQQIMYTASYQIYMYSLNDQISKYVIKVCDMMIHVRDQNYLKSIVKSLKNQLT